MEEINKLFGYSQFRAFIIFMQEKHPRLFLLSKLLFVFLLFYLAAISRLDPDFGWHLTSGFYFRAHGIPAHDIYTYTAHNFKWIDHEWGNDVIVSFIYGWGNYIALAIVFSLLWTASLFINNKSKNSLVLLVATLGILPYSGIRPIAWTAFLLSVLLRITASKNKYLKLSIPILFIIWANLHAGFVIGLIYLIYLGVTKKSRFWTGIFIASVLATFINAYGPVLYVEVMRTLLDPSLHNHITEWKSFNFEFSSNIYILFWAVGFCLFSRKKLRSYIGFDFLLFLSALSANRNFPLFVVSSINKTNDYIEQIYRSFPKKITKSGKNVLLIFLIGFISAVSYSIWLDYFPIQSILSNYPVAQVQYLNKHKCQGNLFNDYNDGGYIIWKLPSTPVFIDGRMPSWKNAHNVEYFNIYLSVIKSQSDQDKVFKEYNITCLLVQNNLTFSRLIKNLSEKKSHWTDVNNSNGHILFIKS